MVVSDQPAPDRVPMIFTGIVVVLQSLAILWLMTSGPAVSIDRDRLIRIELYLEEAHKIALLDEAVKPVVEVLP